MTTAERKELQNKMNVEASKMFNAYLDRTAPIMDRKFAIKTAKIIAVSIVGAIVISAAVSSSMIAMVAVASISFAVIVKSDKIA